MNTLNKISVSSDLRKLETTSSFGVDDINCGDHFPVLSPTALMHPSDGRQLSRMSSSFKQVVQTPGVEEVTEDSQVASPRISARRTVDFADRATPASLGGLGSEAQQVAHSKASANKDEDGFQALHSRRSRSPKATRDSLPKPSLSSQDPFGIPGTSNPFSALAEDNFNEATTSSHSAVVPEDEPVAQPSPSTPTTSELIGSRTDTSSVLPWASTPLPDLPTPPASTSSYCSDERHAGEAEGNSEAREGMLENIVNSVGDFITSHPRTTAVVAVVALTAARWFFTRRR